MADASTWREYDHAALDLAKKGLKGKPGDPLPNFMSVECVALINEDPEAFERRVRESAYALAMAKHGATTAEVMAELPSRKQRREFSRKRRVVQGAIRRARLGQRSSKSGTIRK